MTSGNETNRSTGLANTTVAVVRLMRPRQWTKNGLLFAGVIFGGRLADTEAVLLDTAAFLVFCAASSAVYVFNDIVDRHRDREHPKKCKRPIADGSVSVPLAWGLAIVLLAISLTSAVVLNTMLMVCLMLYLANNLAYSFYIKHVALLDVLSIALGFVFRLLAGIYVIGDLPTTWIVLCTMSLALFLAVSKRRAEFCSVVEANQSRRPVLAKYSMPFLDALLNGASVVTIMSYALFTVASNKNPSLLVTLPFVYYGIIYFMKLVLVEEIGEEPDEILLKHYPLLICILLWLLLYIYIDQSNVRLFR